MPDDRETEPRTYHIASPQVGEVPPLTDEELETLLAAARPGSYIPRLVAELRRVREELRNSAVGMQYHVDVDSCSVCTRQVAAIHVLLPEVPNGK